MAATLQDIQGWFDRGVEHDQAYMIVVCDNYDMTDYPVYVGKDEDVHAEMKRLNKASMQRIMEVYDFSIPKATQMAEHRAWHVPPKTQEA